MQAVRRHANHPPQERRDEIIKHLLVAGADVNAKDKSGRTARDIAVERNLDDIIALLDAATAAEK